MKKYNNTFFVAEYMDLFDKIAIRYHWKAVVGLLNKKVALLIVVLLCFSSINIWAQNDTKADRLFEQGIYAEALELYQNMLTNHADDSVYVKYRIGESMLKMNRPDEALLWFTTAKNEGYSKPDLLYSLGLTYMLLGKYDEALLHFQSYLTFQPDDKRAITKIASCRYAKANGEINPAFTLRPIEALNTTGSEYGVSYYNDFLIYSSTGPKGKLNSRKISPRTGLGYSNLYIAKPDTTMNGVFLSGNKMVDALDQKGNRGVLSYDPQSGKLYCTNCRSGQKNCYISIIKIRGKHFKEVGQLEIGNKEYGIGHPFVTNDGKRLYFTSTMEGGYGGDDIWYTQKQENGEWGNPINVGPTINTAGNEVFPYVHNGRLFFSSDGQTENFGGLDIYVSEITNNGFGRAFNLHHPFNTEDDDFNLIISPNESGGVLVSNRNNQQSDDMYWFEGYPCVSVVEGFVYDKKSKAPLSGATITMYDKKGNPLKKLTADSTAYYHAFLQQGVDYRLNASAAGYDEDNKDVDSKNVDCFVAVNKDNKYDADFYLERHSLAQLDDVILIKDIYYEYDLSRITKQSEDELNQLVALLKKYPQVTILIEAHTDSRGNEEYNQYLSEVRAYSAAYYLENQGIDVARIKTKGYGESKPVIQHPMSEEEQLLNRRTTFTLLSENNAIRESFKVLSTEALLQHETPAQITEHDKWWVEVDVVKQADLHKVYEIEKETDMCVEAIKYDDDTTGLCVGPYNTQQQAADTAKVLINKGFKAVVKQIEPTGKSNPMSAMLF